MSVDAVLSTDELLNEILAPLPLQDLLNAKQVSRRWRGPAAASLDATMARARSAVSACVADSSAFKTLVDYATFISGMVSRPTVSWNAIPIRNLLTTAGKRALLGGEHGVHPAVCRLATMFENGLPGHVQDNDSGRAAPIIGLLARLVAGNVGPHLIIAHKEACECWRESIACLSRLDVTVADETVPPAQRRHMIRSCSRSAGGGVLLTTYSVAVRDLQELTRAHPKTVTFDHAYRHLSTCFQPGTSANKLYTRLGSDYFVTRITTGNSGDSLSARCWELAMSNLTLAHLGNIRSLEHFATEVVERAGRSAADSPDRDLEPFVRMAVSGWYRELLAKMGFLAGSAGSSS